MTDENETLDARDLAGLAAYAQTAEGRRVQPDGPQVIFSEQVRRMEERMRAEGIPQGSENTILGSPDMRLDTPAGRDPQAVEILSEFRAAVNPISGKRYLDEGNARSQGMREMLFAAECQLQAGQPLDMALVAQARRGIAEDKAEAARLKAESDAAELRRFRERGT